MTDPVVPADDPEDTPITDADIASAPEDFDGSEF